MVAQKAALEPPITRLVPPSARDNPADRGEEAVSRAFRVVWERCRAHEGCQRQRKESLEERKAGDRRNRKSD
ncbi:hypothetical protein DL764_000979 [Monosporascus ibericus]|uniref:Uncharacterized protein n=1 Tax=Monosporascus ibericus TaxID=155417 RepID=A0A4Q4TUU6_9PEZI|nr:hypothetical protein DL764_000979 [Monosporascus ibericus]